MRRVLTLAGALAALVTRSDIAVAEARAVVVLAVARNQIPVGVVVKHLPRPAVLILNIVVDDRLRAVVVDKNVPGEISLAVERGR